MAALLVRLRLTLLARSWGRSKGRAAVMVALGLLALGVTVLVGLVVASVRLDDPATGGATVTLVGAGLTLAWLVLPLLVTGMDETLTPSRFALLPVSARALMPGLFLAGLVGLGPLLSLVLAAATVVAWSRTPALTLVAAVGTAVGVATAILAARVATATFAAALSSRRSRDTATIVLALVAMFLGVAVQGVTVFLPRSTTDLAPAVTAALVRLGDALSWTPLGWPWAVAWAVAEGHVGAAVARAAGSVALLAVLGHAWARSLRRSLTSPPATSASGGRVPPTSLADRLFGTGPAGAVAARVLRYLRRDPRHLTSVVSLAVVPVVVGLSAWMSTRTLPAGPGLPLSFVAPLLGLMAAPTVAFDISYDGSSLWTHVSAGVRGRHDRLGRLLAFGALVVPLVALVLLVGLWLSGWRAVLTVTSVTLVAVVGGMGIGSYVGTLWQVPVPPPGESPFSKGTGGGLVSFATAGVTMLATVALCVPVVVLAFARQAALLLPTAAVLSGLALLLGVEVAGRRLDRRWPEVLDAVTYRA